MTMSRSISHFCLLGLSGVALVALAACHKQEEAVAPAPTTSAADAGPTVTDGKLVLPAVKGNPGAAYFTLTNGGTAATVTGVAVVGAEKAEMHETVGTEMKPLLSVPLTAGEKVTFAPGGKHVMVFGIKPDLAAGGSTKITITLSGGATLSAPLKIETAGGADSSMAGMKM